MVWPLSGAFRLTGSNVMESPLDGDQHQLLYQLPPLPDCEAALNLSAPFKAPFLHFLLSSTAYCSQLERAPGWRRKVRKVISFAGWGS